MVGHKEIRFLTPVIPLLNVLASLTLPNWRYEKGCVVKSFSNNKFILKYLFQMAEKFPGPIPGLEHYSRYIFKH